MQISFMEEIFFEETGVNIIGKNIKGMCKSRNLHYGEFYPRMKKVSPSAYFTALPYFCNVIREMTRVNKKGNLKFY